MLDKLMTENTKRLGDAFAAAGFQIRFVGGCVRDAILEVQAKDVDFCTDATPDDMKAIATANNFKYLPTGEAHGTATLVVNGDLFEVTTLRIDVETDGRHAEVEFTTSFEQDAERRDLTFNAMSMDFEGNVYDYFDGVKDLRARRVRFVGIDRLRVEEDFLRILRYFRFAARFDALMEQETLDMFSQPDILDGLNNVSVERFWQEMEKLLSYPAASRIVDAMFRSQVNRALGIFRYNPADVARAPDPVTAMSTLIDAMDVNKFFEFWKMSSDDEAKIRWLISMRSTPVTEESVEIMLNMGKTDRDWIVSLAMLREDIDLADYARTYKVKVMPVTGKDLIASGMQPSPEMGKRLARMREAWAESRFTADQATLMQVA